MVRILSMAAPVAFKKPAKPLLPHGTFLEDYRRRELRELFQ